MFLLSSNRKLKVSYSGATLGLMLAGIGLLSIDLITVVGDTIQLKGA